MDIILHLEEILLHLKEVGITGLGTFYKKKSPGKYDKEKQAFLPPSYVLQFKTEVKNDDELANYIANKENIAQNTAQNSIDQFVEEINKNLELEHEAIINNIGRLFYTEHEGLSFEPSKEVNYGSEFFGLPELPEIHQEETETPTISVPEQADEDVFEEIAEAPTESTFANIPVVEPNIENVELDEVKDDLKNTLKHTESSIEEVTEAPEFIKEQHEENPHRFGHQPESEQNTEKTYVNLEEDKQEILPVTDAPEFIKEQHEEHPNRFGNDPMVNPEVEEPKSIWPKILLIILALAVILGLVYLLKPDLFNNGVKENPNVAITRDTTIVKPDTAKIKQDSIAKADSILKVNLVPNSVDTTKAKLDNAVVNAGETTFEVIAASFRTTKKALEFVQEMKNFGITAKIVPIEGPYKKVSIASFKTEQEALDARPALSKKVRIKELDVKQINTKL